MTDTGAHTNRTNSKKLAIVGIGCLFPKAASKQAYWANIREGVDCISDVPETHWRVADLYDPDPKAPDRTYGKRGGFLDTIDFNPMEFSIQPNILEAIDTSQLLGLVAAREALKDAGYDPASEFARERVSVLLGVTGALEMVIPLGARLGHPIWRQALRDCGLPEDVVDEAVERIAASYVPWQENSFPGLLGNVVAGRISKQFDLGGTNSVVDAACGSSLSAVHMAAMELECGHCDMVITGGIDTFNDIFMYTCFSKTPALSPSNLIRPFDSSSDGTMIGEGLGLVVLKRLEDAERDGDHIYALIRGIGTASDGKKGAIYEPSAHGQQKTLRNAYKLADVDPRTITLVEAHGTGTKVGDAAEVSALREVYGESDGTPWCALGSVKSQIGHTKAAAGSAGLIKAALALHHKVLPPTINVEKPQQVITEGNTPFYINTSARPWLPSSAHPRRAAVSAFGFGGSNFHCVLEEYGAAKSEDDFARCAQIIALSGTDNAALRQQLQQIPDADDERLRRFAARSRANFDAAAPVRLVLVVEAGHNVAELLAKAAALLESGQATSTSPAGIYYSSERISGKIAVLFPGQGAQYPHMLRQLACHSAAMLDTLCAADATITLDDGQPLTSAIYPHSLFSDEARQAAQRRITATNVAQPAIGAVSLGAWNHLRRFGLNADAFAGHSYGELVALCAAGCYSAADLFRLSQLRGKLMAGDGSDKGTMLAVAAPLQQITELIAANNLDLVLANRNTPEQGVLSGARDEIARAQQLCKENGIRCVALDVAAAFHSKLVAAASQPFLQALQQVQINSPHGAVYANKSAAPYPVDGDAIRRLLAEQISSPVEFVAMIEQMAADGVNTFIEVGPGARLTGMVNKILARRPINVVALDASNGKRHGVTDLARLLAQLAALGLPLQLSNWDGDYAATALAQAEPKAPLMTVPICGANYVAKKEQRPPSQRKLVDAATIPVGGNTAPTAPTAAQTAPVSTATDGAALQSLQESMTILQKMQQDTAQLHQQFLTGQAAAIQVMQTLVSGQNTVATPTAQPSAQATCPISAAASLPGQQSDSVSAPAAAATSTTTETAPAAAVSSGVDVAAVLLEVVAEKTGYPQQMLELDMSLDADLGIDSIKRVEILSAMQEKLPQLPALEAQQLAQLQTLRQIVDAMGGGSDAAVTDTASVSTAAETAPPARHKATVQRQVIRTIPISATREAVVLNDDAPVWVVDDCGELAAAIVDGLNRRHITAELISPRHQDVPSALAGLIIPAPAIGTDSYFLADAFTLVQRCESALAAGGILMSVAHLDGYHGFKRPAEVIDPISGGLAGLVKTAAHEWPSAHCKAVDIDTTMPAAAQAEAVIEEFLLQGPVEVAINSSGRFELQLQLEDLDSTAASISLTGDDVIVISGGGRGVTAHVAKALARCGRPTILLLGRSGAPEEEPDWLSAATTEAEVKQALVVHAATPLKPRELNDACRRTLNNRELSANIAALEKLGCRVLYHSVDIRDEQAVAAAVASARQHGRIVGVIHGAGVLADKKISAKTAQQFELVYSTKIAGLQALLQATAADDLRFIALFSSSTGRFGRTGQVDYAVANEVLNKTAQALARQRRNCRVVALNWGPWNGGMVTPALKKIFAAEGIATIDLDAGADYLLRELAHNDDEVELVISAGGNDSTDTTQPDDTSLSQSAAQAVLDIVVNSNDMPFLRHHVIDGKAVVPMAMLIEWLAQGALHGNPGLHFHGFDNLRINKGIVLPADSSSALRIYAEPLRAADEQFVVAVSVRSDDGATLHAGADIILTAELPHQRPAIEPLVIDGGGADSNEIYSGGQLFHGPLLQGLQQVISNSSEGIIAVCAAAQPPHKWMTMPLRDSWLADPLVMDGSFQLMILWSFAHKQMGSLPARTGSYRQYCTTFPPLTRIQCRVTKVGNNSVCANIDFIDEHSRQLLARIADYECTMTADLRQAFANNELKTDQESV